jgi:hypothetical protein
MTTLALLARAADRPAPAVDAYLSTSLRPDDPRARLALAEALVACGLVEQAAELLPVEVTGDEDLARAATLAAQAGKPELGRPPGGARRTVAPGLGLVGAWASLDRSGLVELSLGLVRTGEASASLPVAGVALPFDRPPARWSADEVVVHRVTLALPGGVSEVAVGDQRLRVEVRPFTHDFEGGRLDGWTTAPNKPPAVERFRMGTATRGFQGDWFLHAPATSAPLDDDLDEVCLLIGGAAEAGVHLDRAAEPAAFGRGDAWLREACLRAPAGGARIVLDDRLRAQPGQATGSVLVDDLSCYRRGQPLPCGGGARVLADPR